MTAALNTELIELAESVFADAASSDTGFDGKLWKTLEETGLARLTLPADSGGSEASFADAAIVLSAAGAHAARVPLVETDLQAGWLLTSAGVPIPDGPLTVATGDLDIARTHERASGTLRRVPWARSASVVMLVGDSVLLFDRAGLTVTDGTNVAEEPRDTVTVDGAVTAASVGDHAGTELRLRGALGRACLLAGAARGA
ncbi:MAG: acyl-CoA dehydrogenase, partial [Pseudonocardiales bacterium]|nr:acyl-CoA dehydrogenase [Pseudonocardiales bacterium]